jgi:hypothetical protein
LKPAGAKLVRPYLRNKYKKQAGSIAQDAEHLSSMYEVLDLIPSAGEKK